MLFLAAFFVGSKLVEQGWLTIPPCGLRESMGLPCPGCGGTRTAIAYFNGQLIKAARYNPLVLAFCLNWSLQTLNVALFRWLHRRIHVRWLHLSYNTKFALFTGIFVLNWLVVTQLAHYWIE